MGLFLLLSARYNASGQASRSLRDVLGEKTDAIVQQYYFTNPDTAIILLEPLATEASIAAIWDQLLYIRLNQASIASDVENLDLLSYYLQQGDSINASFGEYINEYDEDGFIKANLYFLYGRYFYDIFNFEEAIHQYSKIFTFKAVSQDSLLAYDTYLSIGQSHYSLGNYEPALHAYKLAQLSLPSESPTYAAGRDYEYKTAFINSLLGRVIFFKAEKTGDHAGLKNAINEYHSSLKLLKGREDETSAQRLFSTLYRRIAAAHSQLSNHDSAIFYVEKTFIKTSSSPVDQVQAYLLAGETYLIARKSKLALSNFKKALNIAEGAFTATSTYKGQALTGLGKTFTLQKDFQNANLMFHKALFCFVQGSWKADGLSLPPLSNVKDENEMLELLEAMGSSVFEQYKIMGTNVNECVEIFKTASALSDQIRKGFQSPESRQLLSGKSSSIYEGGLTAAYEAFILDSLNIEIQNLLLYFMEKKKGAQLLESSKEGFAQTFTGIPQELLNEENKIKGKIAYLKRILSEAEKEDPLLRKKLDTAYKDYETFTAALKKSYPKYFQMQYDTEIVSVKALQQLIPDNTIFVEYFYGKEVIFVLSATPNTFYVEKIEEVSVIEEKVKIVLRGIKDPTYKGLEKSLYALNDLILKKILDKESDINQLWIIPDGLLGYLPFEALLQSKSEKSANKTPDYLVLDYTIKYEFSATLLQYKSNNVRQSSDLEYLGFAPDYKDGLVSNIRFSLSPLKFNQREIEEANQYFKGQTFKNQNATENNFFNHASSADILHLSMHAMADDENAMYSAFYFNSSQLESEKIARDINENDGILHLYELYNYPLKAKLAILSACETGSGEYARGEGIMSLGRAFQYAGCPSVVMSLWQINDMTTAAIMKDFFHNLKKGEAKDKALRNAKIAFLGSEKNKYFLHPYYWSAFVLVGDSNPLIEEEFPLITVIVITLSLITVFFIIFWFKKKGRQV